MSENTHFDYQHSYTEPIKQEDCDKILDGFISNPNMGAVINGGYTDGYLSPSALNQFNGYQESYTQQQNNFNYLSSLHEGDPKSVNMSPYHTLDSFSNVEDTGFFNKDMPEVDGPTSTVFKNMSEFSTPTENLIQQQQQNLQPNISALNQATDSVAAANVSLTNNTPPKIEKNISEDYSMLTEEEKKRKINRDAQRAFRRRKEEKLKEMEMKWMSSENDKQELMKEIEKLRKITSDMSQENRELLKKHSVSTRSFAPNESVSSSDPDVNASSLVSMNNSSPTYNFPDRTEYVKFVYNDSHHAANQDISQLPDLKYTTSEGEEAMTVPKTWEYLFQMLHEKEQEGFTFDTWHIMNLMKGNEVCHGSGAAYMKSFVDLIVNENVKEL